MVETTEPIAAEMPPKDTFRVKAAKLDYLTRRFEKIQKRAKRINCVPPRFEILSTEDVPVMTKPVQKMNESGQWYWHSEPTGRVTRWHEVKLIGERPILAGHKFLGTLEHNAEVGLILRTVPGEAIPVQYRDADATNCDHCRKRIKTRTETFIVEHVETQTYKQVGRQCVADFLGGVDPRNVLALVEMLSQCSDILRAAESEWDDDDERYAGRRYAELYDSEHVLALSSALIRNFGWVPRSKREEWGKCPTADRAESYMTARDKKRMFTDQYGRVDYEEMAKYETTDADAAVAEQALEWARALPESGKELNDYLFNLYQIAKAEAIEPKHFGLACSIVPAYNREQEKLLGIEREKKQFAASQHFGEIGKRTQYIFTVTRHNTCEGYYGVTHILGLQDRDGNYATWFASNGDPGLEVGNTYRVKATVKKHDEYNDIKQTIVNRVVVEEDLTEKPESEWVIPVKAPRKRKAERPALTAELAA
jgi:hypothetical protein